MGGQHGIGSRNFNSDVPHIPVLFVSGDNIPDVTGFYENGGNYGGKLFYKRIDDAWFVWWRASFSEWILSAKVASLGGPYWEKWGADVIGTYMPAGGAEGLAFVGSV